MCRRPVLLMLAAAGVLVACTGGRTDGSTVDDSADAETTIDGTATGAEETIMLASPNGDLQIEVWTDDDGSLRYRVFRGSGEPEEIAISASHLRVSFVEADFVDGLTIASADEPKTRRFELDLPRGKQRSIQVDGVEKSIVIENGTGDRLALDLVAFDDGVAHRFRTLSDGPSTLIADRSSFVFDPDGEMFVQPYDRTGVYTPASEGLYSSGRATTEIYPAFTGWSFPALFRNDDTWTLVTEVGVGRHDVGSRLVNELNSAEHVMAPPPGDQPDGPSITSTVEEPRALPWKVIVSSEDLGAIVASSIADVLARPSEIDDASWVVPGRVSWSWWSESDSPTNPAALRRFIDLAADMGWEYSLIDANWNTMEPGAIADLAAYAAARNVGIFLWYNSGGSNNTVTEEPRDRMADREIRRAEMAWLREVGVVGVKVDFFHGDKQSMNALALDILADAAEAELLVNFHGITSPKGWHVTWPNLLTTEAVRGAEQYKFDQRFPGLAAGHNTVLAFTRNVVGPMDYTPVTLSDVTFPHLTTTAHELALGVVFESGLQHLADTPAAYERLGPDGLDYLRTLPVVWDEIQLLAGQPGSYVVIARRHDQRWWIGGLNGTDEATKVEVDLGVLGGVGDLRLAIDGDGRNDVTFAGHEGSSLAVELAPFGGFVAWPSANS